MFIGILRLSLVTAFIYLSFKNAIAQEHNTTAKPLDNETDYVTPFLTNITNWLIGTCSMYNTTDEPTHHKVLNMTKKEISGYDMATTDNTTKYIEETIIPMARGLLHGLIDEYEEYKNKGETADEFVHPCNCTVLLTIGQLGNFTYNDTIAINEECRQEYFARL